MALPGFFVRRLRYRAGFWVARRFGWRSVLA